MSFGGIVEWGTRQAIVLVEAAVADAIRRHDEELSRLVRSLERAATRLEPRTK